ncbi:transporter substrate-binding domain-containing protein [Plantactinospora sp. B5E13]|uniref:transporter substrate-binding domain-containing protein n=1 Tax=unclassified Plantactinospora TaxID=2631981 RepID=UPI00325EAE29
MKISSILPRPVRRPVSAALVGVLVTGAAVACSIGGTAPEPNPDDPARYLSGTVAIGINPEQPGLSEYDNGTWTGFDVAFAHWLEREIGFEASFVSIPLDQRESRLVNKNVKLVISTFSITDTRREQIDFAGPYFLDSQGILTQGDQEIEDFDSLRGKSVCVPSGSTSAERLREMGIAPAEEPSLERCVQRVVDGEVLAVSTDRVVLEGAAAAPQWAGYDLQVPKNFRYGRDAYGIGLPNNFPKTCAFLTEKIKKFILDEWQPKFDQNLKFASADDRMPDVNGLDPCEQPTGAAGASTPR